MLEKSILVNLVYVVAAVLFIAGLKLQGHPASARKGNLVSVLGMFTAVIVTLIDQKIISFEYILCGVLVGGVAGAWFARRVQMTAMPELVSLFNGFGGLASLALGMTTLTGSNIERVTPGIAVVAYLSVLIGAVTFSGSVIAWGKLSGKMTSRAIIFPGQRVVYALVLIGLLVLGGQVAFDPQNIVWFYIVAGLALFFGVLATIPIGGADMPVVIPPRLRPRQSRN